MADDDALERYSLPGHDRSERGTRGDHFGSLSRTRLPGGQRWHALGRSSRTRSRVRHDVPILRRAAVGDGGRRACAGWVAVLPVASEPGCCKTAGGIQRSAGGLATSVDQPVVREDHVKPKISKTDGRWTLTRPGYGFTPASTTTHGSWKAARDALLESAVSSAGPIVERGHHTLTSVNYYGYPQRGTIRMEDTHG